MHMAGFWKKGGGLGVGVCFVRVSWYWKHVPSWCGVARAGGAAGRRRGGGGRRGGALRSSPPPRGAPRPSLSLGLSLAHTHGRESTLVLSPPVMLGEIISGGFCESARPCENGGGMGEVGRRTGGPPLLPLPPSPPSLSLSLSASHRQHKPPVGHRPPEVGRLGPRRRRDERFEAGAQAARGGGAGHDVGRVGGKVGEEGVFPCFASRVSRGGGAKKRGGECVW